MQLNSGLYLEEEEEEGGGHCARGAENEVRDEERGCGPNCAKLFGMIAVVQKYVALLGHAEVLDMMKRVNF
jgi:hypothetical protein